MTPEEVGLLLAALGFDNSTHLYLASHKVYGEERRISALRSLFPLMQDKKSLTSTEKRACIKGKASLLAVVDYYVSIHGDIFISEPKEKTSLSVFPRLLVQIFKFYVMTY